MKHLALLLALLSSTSFSAVYQWTDENGNVQFSDKKPSHIEAEQKTYQSSTPEVDPELEKYRQQIKLNEIERKRQQEIDAKQQAKSKQKKAAIDQYCKRLKSEILIDNKVVGWQTQNPDGTVTPWTGEQRTSYTKALKDKYNKHCM